MHHAPGSSAGFPANLMNIMTYWLLWCDVGKLTTDDPISWEKTASSSISSFFLLHSILSSLLFILFFCLLPSLQSPFVFSSSHCSLLHLLPLFYFLFFPVFLQCLFFILWIDHVPLRITIYFNHLFFPLLLILVLHPFCKELGFLVFLFLVLYFFLPFSVHSASVVNHLLRLHPFIQRLFSHYLFVCKYHSLTNS